MLTRRQRHLMVAITAHETAKAFAEIMAEVNALAGLSRAEIERFRLAVLGKGIDSAQTRTL